MSSKHPDSRAFAALFMTFFGAIWLLSWCLRTFGPSAETLIALLTASIVLGVAARYLKNSRSTDPDWVTYFKKYRRSFYLINVVQWMMIVAVVVIFPKLGYSEWIEASIICIVGLHFFPLAHIFEISQFYMTEGFMVLVAIFLPLISTTWPGSALGSLGAGIILWVSSIYMLANKPDSN